MKKKIDPCIVQFKVLYVKFIENKIYSLTKSVRKTKIGYKKEYIISGLLPLNNGQKYLETYLSWKNFDILNDDEKTKTVTILKGGRLYEKSHRRSTTTTIN